MSLPSSDFQDPQMSLSPDASSNSSPNAPTLESGSEESASYVKLAMRNMVKKGRKSLTHFFLTTTALIGLLVGLSYLTR